MEFSENYLAQVKTSFSKRISAFFILYLVVFFLLCLISFALFSAYTPECSYIISSNTSKNVFYAAVDYIREEMPTTVSLLLIFLSSFTLVNKAVSVIVCAWHGFSIGCAAAMTGGNFILALSEMYSVGIILDFISTVLIALLASYSAVYSSCIVYTYSCEEHKLSSALFAEFIKLFLFLSGLIYLVGFTAKIFT